MVSVPPDDGRPKEPHILANELYNRLLNFDHFSTSFLTEANRKQMHSEMLRVHEKHFKKLSQSRSLEYIFQPRFIEILEKFNYLLFDHTRNGKVVIKELSSKFQEIKKYIKDSLLGLSDNNEEEDIEDYPENINKSTILDTIVAEMDKRTAELQEIEKKLPQANKLAMRLTSSKCDVGDKLLPYDRWMNHYMTVLERYNWLEKEYDRLIAENNESKVTDLLSEKNVIQLEPLRKINSAAPKIATTDLINHVKTTLESFRTLKSSDPDPCYEDFEDKVKKCIESKVNAVEDLELKEKLKNMHVNEWIRKIYDAYIKQLKIAREKISSKALDDYCDKEDFDEGQIKCYEDLKAEVKKEELENKDQIEQILNGNSQENENGKTESITSENIETTDIDEECSIHSSECRSDDEREHDCDLDDSKSNSDNPTTDCNTDNEKIEHPKIPQISSRILKRPLSDQVPVPIVNEGLKIDSDGPVENNIKEAPTNLADDEIMKHPYYEMLLNLGFNPERVYLQLQCLKSDEFSDYISALTSENRSPEKSQETTLIPECLNSDENHKNSPDSQVLVKEAASALYISSDNESQRVPARKKIKTDEIIILDSD